MYIKQQRYLKPSSRLELSILLYKCTNQLRATGRFFDNDICVSNKLPGADYYISTRWLKYAIRKRWLVKCIKGLFTIDENEILKYIKRRVLATISFYDKYDKGRYKQVVVDNYFELKVYPWYLRKQIYYFPICGFNPKKIKWY